MVQQDNIKKLKDRFVKYYRQLPHKSLSANFIGRTLDTINLWEKSDANFSACVLRAKAEWAREKSKKVKSTEWLLERVLKEEFAQRQEITGGYGERLPTPILGELSCQNSQELKSKMQIEFIYDGDVPTKTGV